MAFESIAGVGAQSVENDKNKAWDIAMTQWSHSHDKTMQRRQYEMQQGLNSQMARLSREARINSASDAALGLRAAGMNPALSQGASFGSVGSGGSVAAPSTPPHTSTPSNLGALALEGLKYAEVEQDLMKSQAELNRAAAMEHRAVAGPKVIEEQNLVSENEMANSLIQDWIDRHINSADPDAKATAEFMRAQNEAYTTGSLKALNTWMQFTHDQKQRAMENARNEYEKRIYDLRNQNDVARVIYDLPKHERHAIISEVMKTQQMLLNLKSEKNLTDEQIEAFKAQAAKTTAEAAKIYHTDPAAMWDNEDWRNLLLYGGEKVGDAVISVGGNVAGGAVAGKVIKSVSSPNAKTGNMENLKADYYDYPKIPIQYERTPLGDLW